MADPTKPAEELLTSWSTSQRQAWEAWLQALEGAGGLQTEAARKQSLDASKRAMQQALDAQADGARVWADSVAAWARQVPAPVVASSAEAEATDLWAKSLTSWAEQVALMTKQWTEAQKTFWTTWFDSLDYLEPSRPPNPAWEQGRGLLQAWEQTVRQMLETQARWTEFWMPKPPKPRSESDPPKER